jgi:hypothetical protein
VLVLTLTGCQRSAPAPDLSPADIAAIRATSDRWMAAVHAGRWDDAAATYTADAIVWFPGAVYEERVAIRRFLETMQPVGPYQDPPHGVRFGAFDDCACRRRSARGIGPVPRLGYGRPMGHGSTIETWLVPYRDRLNRDEHTDARVLRRRW